MGWTIPSGRRRWQFVCEQLMMIGLWCNMATWFKYHSIPQTTRRNLFRWMLKQKMKYVIIFLGRNIFATASVNLRRNCGTSAKRSMRVCPLKRKLALILFEPNSTDSRELEMKVVCKLSIGWVTSQMSYMVSVLKTSLVMKCWRSCSEHWTVHSTLLFWWFAKELIS
jgi:hypothetical protein